MADIAFSHSFLTLSSVHRAHRSSYLPWCSYRSLVSVTRSCPCRSFLRASKFRPFGTQDEEELESVVEPGAERNGVVLGTVGEGQLGQDERDDNVLPNDLEGAIQQSSQSTAYFFSAGGTRAIVELLLPELENLNEDGAQLRLWDLARLYLESLQTNLGTQRVKAVFPDAGVAALLKHQWNDATFSFGSLNDRKPVSYDDEAVVLVAPDYQMLDKVQSISASLLGDDGNAPIPLIMWNPHLFSGDVGIGLNVRRIRNDFFSTFTVVYSMRPLPVGAIFRRYPGLWQVFVDDVELPGRYILAQQGPRRPDPDDLDTLLSGGQTERKDEQSSPFVNALAAFASLNRFIRSLSR